MHHNSDRTRRRSARLIVLVCLLAAAGVVCASLFGPSWWRAIERAAERRAAYRNLPQGGEKNEQEEIEERAQAAFDRLAYPANKIPPAWRAQALAHVRRSVRDGLDFARPASGVASQAAGRPIDRATWTSIGPAPINDATASANAYRYGLVTGRINALAIDPTNPAVAYAGATAGGLWKTTSCCSAATSWSPLWESANAVSQAVGTIKLDPTNPNIIYAGTGDFDAADQFGEGVMKSVDGGASWTQLGRNVFTPFAAGTPDKPEQNIGAIEIDPRHPNTVLAGTRHGFFMSYNGGASWSRYDLHTREGQSQRVSSIVLDSSTNPTTMYVAVGYPYASAMYGNIGGGNGVYKAALPNAGAPSFTLLTNGWPANTGSGLSNEVGNIRLAKSAQNPQILYAQVGDYTNLNALGTWITLNGGASWAQLAGSDDASYLDCAGQATDELQDWYNLFIGVDPSDDKTLYVGRTSLYKLVLNNARSAVTSIADLGSVYSNTCTGYGKLHPDQHAVAMIAGGKFLAGNDGGVYLANGSPGGFTALNSGLNISQFYAGQLGANFASSTTQYAFGGLQDNGSASWDFSSGGTEWQGRSNGGDGFFAAFDPIGGTLAGGNWYSEYVYGALDCSTGGARGPFLPCAGGWAGSTLQSPDRSDWATPFTLDQIHCTLANCKNIMLGTYRLWASGTGGTNAAAWTAVSADLTKGAFAGNNAQHTLIDVRFAPSNPKSALAGADDGSVQWSNTIYTGANCTEAASNSALFSCAPNPSAGWVNLTKGNTVLPDRAIQGVGFDPSNDQIVYAAAGGFNTNTPATPGHLFRASCTTNCANSASWTWSNKTGNLPDVPADSVIANPNNRKQVFVGTHFGFYYTNDIDAATVTWQRYQNNLPNTVIKYLTIDRGATTLGAFTYGRSLYSIQLPGPAGFDALPAAPSALSAIAAAASQIDLSWVDTSSDESGFTIERCAGAGCTNFAPIATVGANMTSYHDTGLAANTSYSYRVRALNPAGSSGYSETASAITPESGPQRRVYLPLTIR